MRARARIKPSKPASAMSLVVGIIFVIVGLSMIPTFGAFGVLWTIVVLVMVCYSAANLLSEEGIAEEVIDVETLAAPDAQAVASSPALSTSQRLLDLDDLKLKGLITEDEYAQQRKRILNGI